MAKSSIEIHTWAPGSGVPRAVWKQTYPWDRSHFHCSNCDCGKRFYDQEPLTPYCPYCGAYMYNCVYIDEVDKEEEE